MPIQIFGGKKNAALGATKAQLPFSEGKYQLLNSWNKILFPTILYHLNSQLTHPNRSIMLARTNIALKRYEKAENYILSLFPIFPRWVPLNDLKLSDRPVTQKILRSMLKWWNIAGN